MRLLSLLKCIQALIEEVLLGREQVGRRFGFPIDYRRRKGSEQGVGNREQKSDNKLEPFQEAVVSDLGAAQQMACLFYSLFLIQCSLYLPRSLDPE
jgi:hypothetical protein